jgi:hypothetical protein
VSPRIAPEVTFNEPMTHGDAASWFLIAPYVPIRKLEWSKNTLRAELGDSLRAGQTYALVIAPGAADARANRTRDPRAIPFTTASALPPGQMAGRVDGRGHEPRGVFVWAYRADLGHAPDSTARDFDALGIAGSDGRFLLAGLPVPSRWKLYAFHDANRTLSFEPGTDHLTALPDTVALTQQTPAVDSLVVPSIDPSAPGEAAGSVVDSLAPPGIPIRIQAEAISAPVGEKPREFAVERGAFRIPLPAGRYRLRVYVDLDRSGRLDAPPEPVSDPIEVEIQAGVRVSDLVLVAPGLPPPGGGAPGGGR